MSTENNPSTRFNILVAIVIAALAVIGAFITNFESEASTMSGLASSDEQMDYYRAMGAQISGDADTNYEFGTAYQLWYEYDLLYKGALKREDQEAAATYQKLRDDLSKTSELLKAPYFIAETGQLNLPRYKADHYTMLVVELQERQRAASDVSNAWDQKSSEYTLQLTLLAVAGFLLGLALMTKSTIARLVFAGSGIPMVAVIAIYAYFLSIQSVYDLRETGAIEPYARGVALSEQRNWEAALEQFTLAIDQAGTKYPYANAYIQRALVHSERGDFAAAVNDFDFAIEAGASDANATGGLVWALFQQGRFEEAVQAGRKALERTPDQLWLRHRVNMSLLASGEVDAATAEYELLLDKAVEQIEAEKALGGDGSAILWQLKEASFQLEQLATLLDKNEVSPVRAAVGKSASVSQAARELSERLLTSSVVLEHNLALIPVTGAKVDAVVSPLEFNLLQTSDGKYVYRVDVRFNFEGLQPGQILTIKVFRNGVEELAWEVSEPWSQADSGLATIPLSPSYADVYAVAPGNYVVKMYLNGQFVQQSSFAVGNEAGLVGDGEQGMDFPDIYDAYDFSSLDIFYTEGYEDYYSFYYDDLFFFEDFSDDWLYYYYSEDLGWDYQYQEDDWYWVCDPNLDPYCSTDYTFVCDPALDPDCVIDTDGTQSYCDPADPYCDTSEVTCDPNVDPDCAPDPSYCDPDDPSCIDDAYDCDPNDPSCVTDESTCDPYSDPDCPGYEDVPPDEYTCDPAYDLDCPGYEDPPPDEYTCDPAYDPDCPGYEDPPPDEEYYEEPLPDEFACDPEFDPDCGTGE